MKIAFIHFWTLRLRRGIETLTLSLANDLAERGIDVSILAARQTQEPLVKPSPRVRIKQFPTFRYYESITISPLYAADMICERYDAVIVFFADFGEGIALKLAAPLRAPHLILYLTFPYESATHRYRAYQRWGWDKQAIQIWADATYTAQRGQEVLNRPVAVLPSGTDPYRFKPDSTKRVALRKQFGFGEEDVVLLNVAALEERKGIGRVIESLPEIRKQCRNVRYLILGEGNERAKLEQRVQELGLGQHVFFAGTTSNLADYYNAADIFVMLPDHEAGSIACLEAMASGLPVVVSETGGYAEVVNTTNGRMIDAFDHAAIVQTIVELALDADFRAKLGKSGRTRILTDFSWQRIGERCVQMLHAL
ncbi:phosphatidyl-myo-inositol dimannoside synthase [Methylococcales bacterium]|nr:phosphatidyl-myo-inositol dimannoside synthase [Methylococcales bacterium]